MRHYLLLLLLAVTVSTTTAQFSAYYPNGKKVDFTFRTIGDLLDSLGEKETTSYQHKLGVVFYKRLTNDPVAILFMDGAHPDKIPQMVAAYDYDAYLYSYDYYAELKRMVKDSSLTPTYLRAVFGQPDVDVPQSDTDSRTWIYKHRNVEIVFRDSIALSADVVPYIAMYRHKLSIDQFIVTGTDYSIGFEVNLMNRARKTVKYLYFTVTARNPVNDVVGSRTVKAIGPIEPYESVQYTFDNVVISRGSQYLLVDQIKVEYMDGSTHVIPKADVPLITITDWEAYGQQSLGR
jgi:hypothetical protein